MKCVLVQSELSMVDSYYRVSLIFIRVKKTLLELPRSSTSVLLTRTLMKRDITTCLFGYVGLAGHEVLLAPSQLRVQHPESSLQAGYIRLTSE
jgi:hypothetical protein